VGVRKGFKMKIGITGTHGTGKTGFALRMAAHLKSDHPGENVGILTEVARTCPLPINKETSELAQSWIFHGQLVREIELEARNEILICDRTILDSIAYSERAGFKAQALMHLSIALDWMSSYDELYFLRPSIAPANDGFRDTDPDFQKDIDRILAGYIETYGISVAQVIVGNPKTQ